MKRTDPHAEALKVADRWLYDHRDSRLLVQKDTLVSLIESQRAEAVEEANRMRESHGQPCHFCDLPVDDMAADPGRWGVALAHPDTPGVVRWHHAGCVSARLVDRPGIERAAKIEALEDALNMGSAQPCPVHGAYDSLVIDLLEDDHAAG